MSKSIYHHTHTADLRRLGFGDIADAYEASASTSDSLPITNDHNVDQALESRINAAAKALANEDEFPQGSTLRPEIERMARRYHRRIWLHHYSA